MNVKKNLLTNKTIKKDSNYSKAKNIKGKQPFIITKELIDECLVECLN